jgi:hypothetical protein
MVGRTISVDRKRIAQSKELRIAFATPIRSSRARVRLVTSSGRESKLQEPVFHSSLHVKIFRPTVAHDFRPRIARKPPVCCRGNFAIAQETASQPNFSITVLFSSKLNQILAT